MRTVDFIRQLLAGGGMKSTLLAFATHFKDNRRRHASTDREILEKKPLSRRDMQNF
jgi:hypothetical protein